MFMGWFKEAQNYYSDKQLVDLIKKQADIKDLQSEGRDLSVSDSQFAQNFTLYDVQRYVMDSYNTKVALSETPKCIKISLLINHNFLGTIAWNEYWSFGTDEFKEAAKLYKDICKEIKDMTEEFIQEGTTTAIFWPMLRHRIEKLKLRKQVKSNIPNYNYSKDIEIAPDWRKNIYGPRYPDYNEGSYEDDKTYGGRVGKQAD